MEDCVFCKIVKGEIPTEIVWEDDAHIAFLSIYPNTDGFTVVATKKHNPSYAFENDDKVLTEIVLATKKVAKLLESTFEDVARCGMFFEGYGVDHLHSKLFPMHGTIGNIDWEKLAKAKPHVFFEKYPGYLSSHDSSRANDNELKTIADDIRKVSGFKT